MEDHAPGPALSPAAFSKERVAAHRCRVICYLHKADEVQIRLDFSELSAWRMAFVSE